MAKKKPANAGAKRKPSNTKPTKAESKTTPTDAETEAKPVAGPPKEVGDSAVDDAVASEPDRRDFLGRAATTGMLVGLGASYGTFAYMGARFLFPVDSGEPQWQFAARVSDLAVGAAVDFRSPGGQSVVIARRSDGTDAEKDFVALSSVCPHLGCRVHWEASNERFFCPCHNGAFDRDGQPTEGPPLAASQTLTRFPLKIESGLLYIALPKQQLAQTDTEEDPVA